MFYVHMKARSTPSIDMTEKIFVYWRDKDGFYSHRGPLTVEELAQLVTELLEESHVTLSRVVECFLDLPEGIPLIKGTRLKVPKDGPLILEFP